MTRADCRRWRDIRPYDCGDLGGGSGPGSESTFNLPGSHVCQREPGTFVPIRMTAGYWVGDNAILDDAWNGPGTGAEDEDNALILSLDGQLAAGGPCASIERAAEAAVPLVSEPLFDLWLDSDVVGTTRPAPMPGGGAGAAGAFADRGAGVCP